MQRQPLQPLYHRSVTRVLAGIILANAVPGLYAQSAPRFDVADIHKSGPATNPYTFLSGAVLRGARYDLRKATMLDLIRVAYQMDPEMIVGGPNWLEFDRFDIAAKAPPGSSPETVRVMLQSLLADRFNLAVHRDTRPMPAFILAQGKGAPKLRESTGAANSECQYQPQPGGGAGIACRNMTMKAFAERLHAGIAGDYLMERVVDSTGLDGAWDFDLKWNRRSQILPPGAERTTIFDAIDKQLGLSLKLQTAPVEVLVIDRANENPTPNPPGVALKIPPPETDFEVADLKPSKPGELGGGMRVTPGGGFEAKAMDMRVLLAAAWDIDWDHLERFASLPKWVESAKFDIHAKASTETNAPPFMGSGYIDDDVRLMLRALLVERFKIQWHYEDRPVNAYTLAAGKPKMRRGDTAHRASCKEARTVANDPRDQNPRLSELLQCQNATMSQFAAKLQELAPDEFAYPVEDATGLTGGWDFTLNFSPAWMLRTGSDAGQESRAAEPDGAISISEAVNKQLGLKLEMRKRMLPVVVIDHIEEKPAEN